MTTRISVFFLGLCLLAWIGCAGHPSAPGPNGATLATEVATAKAPCDRVVVVGGQVPFDFGWARTDGVTISWSDDGGSLDPATEWSAVWTAPKTSGVFHVTVTFSGNGKTGAQTFAITVLSTQAQVDSFKSSCATANAPPQLSPIGAHTDAATGLTVIILANSAAIAHNGRLWLDSKVRNDGSQDVTMLNCGGGLSSYLYFRPAAGSAMSGPPTQTDADLQEILSHGIPTWCCDSDRLGVLHPDETQEEDGDTLQFGAPENEVAQGVQGTTMGDGVYEIVAVVDLPPAPDGTCRCDLSHEPAVRASATITVGP